MSKPTDKQNPTNEIEATEPVGPIPRHPWAGAIELGWEVTKAAFDRDAEEKQTHNHKGKKQ